MKYVVTDGEKRVSVWKDMIAGAHMFNEREVRAVLLEIGNSIGFGRAQQILGEEWEREHNCAPRGRMGITIKDESFAQTLGEPVAVPDGWINTVRAVLTALDKATGDTDPNIDPDMTDDEVRDE